MEDLALSGGTGLGAGIHDAADENIDRHQVEWPLHPEIQIKNFFRRTIAKYSKAIKLKSNETKGYLCRGTAKYQIGDFQGAMEDFSKAIELRSDYAEAYVNRAWAHFMLGQRSEALADLAKATELDFPIAEDAYDIFKHGNETP